MNIANLLTMIRILLSVIIIIIYHMTFEYRNIFILMFFMIACVTDWVDGYLARLFKISTKFGAFLDPLADKLLVISTLTILTISINKTYITIPFIIIVVREICVTVLRVLISFGLRKIKNIEIKVNYVAKIKTAAQMVSMNILLLHSLDFIHQDIVLISGIFLLYLAVAASIISAYIYIKNYIKY